MLLRLHYYSREEQEALRSKMRIPDRSLRCQPTWGWLSRHQLSAVSESMSWTILYLRLGAPGCSLWPWYHTPAVRPPPPPPPPPLPPHLTPLFSCVSSYSLIKISLAGWTDQLMSDASRRWWRAAPPAQCEGVPLPVLHTTHSLHSESIDISCSIAFIQVTNILLTCAFTLQHFGLPVWNVAMMMIIHTFVCYYLFFFIGVNKILFDWGHEISSCMKCVQLYNEITIFIHCIKIFLFDLFVLRRQLSEKMLTVRGIFADTVNI